MAIVRWIKSLLGFSEVATERPAAVAADPSPTEAEMQSALRKLEEMLKPAVFGEVGGVKPDKTDRAMSWWGGNFLAAEGEVAPRCSVSGRPLHPLLQIRVDELPYTPPAFSNVLLVTIWIDLEEVPLRGVENGTGFAVRTYSSLANLVPIGPGYRESDQMPTFPVLWRGSLAEQPSWEDIALELPAAVAQADDADWFFDSRYALEARGHYPTCPVKLGGWPTWIQGASWPANAEFCLQIDSCAKGRFGVGDSGSIYLFKTPDGWALRSDFF